LLLTLVAVTAVVSGLRHAEAQAPPIEFEDCGRDWQCGSLVVPLDYDDAGGRTIEIAVARLPARDPDKRIGILLTNPGGPGAGGISFARAWSSIIEDDIRDRFDIVAFDPRGTGDSVPVECDDYLVDLYGVDQSPDSSAEYDTLLSLARDYAAACRATYGDLLDHLGTANVARDMDRIRQALGEETLNYVGYSYGTRIGAVYADLFPGRVRAFVLDGAIDNSLSNDEAALQQAAGFDLALGNFLAECERRDCDLAEDGDPYAAVTGILAAAELAPIPAPSASRDARPGEVILGIVAALYDERSWSLLASALAEARDGDASSLVTLADSYLTLSSTAVLMAVNCSDEDLPAEPVDTFAEYQRELPRLAQVSPTFGPTMAVDSCPFWTSVPDPVGIPDAVGAPPILVIGTTGDPATPYEWAEALADQLASGVLIRHEGEGHTVYAGGGSSCVDELVDAFLIALDTPASGVTCVGDDDPLAPGVVPTPRAPDTGSPRAETGHVALLVAFFGVAMLVFVAAVTVARLWRRP